MNYEITDHEQCICVKLQADALDVSTIASFRDTFDDLLEKSAHIVLDMNSVEFIDSTGLGGLLSLMRMCIERDGDMRLVCLQEQVLSMLRLVRMNKVMSIYGNVEEAVVKW